MKNKTDQATNQTNEKVDEYKKLSNGEFFKVSFWVIKFMFKLTPKYATLYSIYEIFNRLKEIINTLIIARMIDVLVNSIKEGTAEIEKLYWYLGILLIYNIANTVLGFFGNLARNGLRVYSRPRLKTKLYEKLNELGIQTLEDPDINNKIHRVNMYMGDMIQYYFQSFGLVSDLISLATVVVIIYSFFPLFILLMLCVLLPYYFLDKKFRSLLYKYIYDNTEEQRKSYGAANELTTSQELHEITITRAFKFLDEKFRNFQEKYIKKWMDIVFNWRLRVSFTWLLSDALVIFGIAKMFTDAINNVISVGDAVFRYRMLFSLESNLIGVLSSFNDLGESAIRIKDTYDLMNLQPMIKDGEQDMELLTKGPQIKLNTINFKYPNTEKLVIKNLNLNISPGEKLAIVGANGAGKTTLVKLIARFYQPTSGSVQINEHDLKKLKIESLYKNMGVLFQDFNQYPFLTARENILIGDVESSDVEEKIIDSARKADAYKFIEEFKHGFNQILSEKFKEGIRPSTGQWQKLAIARFFFRNPAIVIFDEPTASIDAVSEYNIFNSIYKYFENKTVIIISHRFSTVRNADRIIVLDDGSIIEEGTHKQLMQLKGKYADAFKLQAEGYSIESDEL